MNKYILHWWLVVSVLMLSLGMFFYTGFFYVVLLKDVTYISFVVIALTMWATFSLGYNFYQAIQNNRAMNTRNYYFLASMMPLFGLLGTIVGFIIMFGESHLDQFDPSNVEAGKTIISHLAAGLGTKLFSTLFGLLGNVVLSIQLNEVENWNDEKEEA